MKTLGIIGGIGPESTIEYYRGIIAAYQQRIGRKSYPSLLLNSIPLEHMLELVGADDLDALAAYLCDEIDKLSRAGADFAVIAANTPHMAFDRIRACSPIPLISIVDETAKVARHLGMRRVGLFGTRFTMEAGFYADVFERYRIEIITPGPAERDFIHGKYLSELLRGVFLDETRHSLIEIAQSMRDEHGIGALILGGTELPLILTSEEEVGIPLLNTTAIHVQSIVERMLEEG